MFLAPQILGYRKPHGLGDPLTILRMAPLTHGTGLIEVMFEVMRYIITFYNYS